jgi:hypothetical protein
MKRIALRVLKAASLVLALVVAGLGVFAYVEVSHFDASIDKVYDVPVPDVTRSTDLAVLARGRHVVESIGGCTGGLCHGADLGGGKPIELGPLGVLTAPNITPANVVAAYSDGEIARLVRHGIKKDGRTVRLMPAQDFNWLPDSDVLAIVSYLRTVPPVDRPNGTSEIKTLGKVLDRREQVVLDVARHIDHAKIDSPPAPARTAEYGAFIGRLCSGCHGETLSGGRIPGTPAAIPAPLNLTPDASGLRDWTYADFEKLMRAAIRKNGKPLDPFMPVEAWRNFDDTEMHALWEYLRTLPPRPFGGR